MKQLPTDTPSHVKALNKLEREAGDQGTVTLPDKIEQRNIDYVYLAKLDSIEKMKRQQSLAHCNKRVNPKHLSTTIGW